MRKLNKDDVSASFLNPGSVLDQTEIAKGFRVIDFGAGSGHFTLEAAQRVGETGSVVAVDVLVSSLETIEGTARVQRMQNVSCVNANLEKENSEKIFSNSFDLVIAKDILFQSKDKAAVLREACRVLKTGGDLLVVEWNDQKRTIGPDIALRVGEKELRQMVKEANFSIKKTILAGDYHYGFVAEKRRKEDEEYNGKFFSEIS